MTEQALCRSAPKIFTALADTIEWIAKSNGMAITHYLKCKLKSMVGHQRSDTDLCPLAATLWYMVQRGADDGPLFKFHDGKYLTRDWFVSAVHSVLVATSRVNPTHCVRHSFCIYQCCKLRPAGLVDKNSQAVGEFSLHPLHLDTQGDTLCSVEVIGQQPLTLGQSCRHDGVFIT